MAVLNKIEKIDAETLRYEDGTTVVGQPAAPNLSVHEMQMSMENLGRNALMPKLNEVVDAVNGSYSKEETDRAIEDKVQEIGAGDMTKAVYDPQGWERDVFAYADSKTAAVKEELDTALDGVREKLSKKELLWENANPAAAFGAQTIQLGVDLSAYDYVHIIVTGVNISDTSLLVEPGGAFTFTTGAPSTQSTTQATPYMVTRSGNVLDTAIQFGACQQGQNGNYTFNATNRMIPTKIYGIKL